MTSLTPCENIVVDITEVSSGKSGPWRSSRAGSTPADSDDGHVVTLFNTRSSHTRHLPINTPPPVSTRISAENGEETDPPPADRLPWTFTFFSASSPAGQFRQQMAQHQHIRADSFWFFFTI